MDIHVVRNTYRRYAPIYDLLFSKFFQEGWQLATRIINENASKNAKILEVGVGTGASLPFYRADLHITGVDISPEMLQKAQKKIAADKVLANVRLLEMNAERLEFESDSFDWVVAMHVVSVVADVNNFLEEIHRVCKPGGDIIILNHFSSESPVAKWMEKGISKFHKFCGFHADFPVGPLLDYPHFKLVRSYKTNFLGYWKLLHFKKGQI